MPGSRKITRRTAVGGIGIGALGVVAAPSILKAQTKEIVVGGAASHKPWVESTVQPFFEQKYNCKIVYEGTRSLVNLEKMQKNKDKQYLSVVQMDDPVMILAVKEGLLEKLTADKVPNLANLRPGAIHMDGMWANYVVPWQGIAYNTKALPNGVASWSEVWDPEVQGPRDPALPAEYGRPGESVHRLTPRHRKADGGGAQGPRRRLQAPRQAQAQPAHRLYADAASLQSIWSRARRG